jgi:Uma2 family endonuclease
MEFPLDIPPPMTVDEFIAWPGDGVNGLHQLIEGEPVAMVETDLRHSLLRGEIAAVLGNHMRASSPHCRAYFSVGIQPHAGASTNVRVPDVAVSCAPFEDGYWLRDPVVVIEIISPENARETRESVRAYLSIPSLREVLVVHAHEIRAELLRLQPDGFWPPDPTIWTAGDTIELDSVGFRHELAKLYRE